MAYIVLNMTAGGVSEAEVCSGCAHRFEYGEQMNAVASENGDPLGWYCNSCVQQWWMKDAQHYDLPGFQRFGIKVPCTVPVEATVRMLIALISYVQGVKSVDRQMSNYREIAEAAIKPQHVEDLREYETLQVP